MPVCRLCPASLCVNIRVTYLFGVGFRRILCIEEQPLLVKCFVERKPHIKTSHIYLKQDTSILKLEQYIRDATGAYRLYAALYIGTTAYRLYVELYVGNTVPG